MVLCAADVGKRSADFPSGRISPPTAWRSTAISATPRGGRRFITSRSCGWDASTSRRGCASTTSAHVCAISVRPTSTVRSATDASRPSPNGTRCTSRSCSCFPKRRPSTASTTVIRSTHRSPRVTRRADSTPRCSPKCCRTASWNAWASTGTVTTTSTAWWPTNPKRAGTSRSAATSRSQTAASAARRRSSTSSSATSSSPSFRRDRPPAA